MSTDNFWGDASMKNPMEFREWFKILFRVWRPHLSPNQFLTALFIFDRTAAWGKQWEVITHDHFINGVTGRDGQVYETGLRMSRPTLIESLRWLAAVGAIHMRPVKQCRTAYALNYEWNPEQPLESNAMPLAKPKRLHTLQSDTPAPEAPKVGLTKPKSNHSSGKETLPLTGKETLPHNRREDNCKAKASLAKARQVSVRQEPNSLDLDSTLAAASQRSLAKRKARQAVWSATSASTVWFDLHSLHFPNTAALAVTKTDICILHKYGRRWMGSKRPVAEWLEFLGWVVMRWAALRESQFAWMKTNSPAIPSIRFLVKLSDRFEQAYEHQATTDRLATLPTREREIEARVRKGMARDLAEQEVDQRLGLSEDRQAIERAAAEIKRQRLSLQTQGRDQAEAEARNQHWAKYRTVPKNEAPAFEPWE